ncbi:hypothetical protein Pfo_003392 [Paulownia fortunei]|nr:hypothetical protein Pfo_003392 [Paulownia fortunei]
MYRHGIAFGSVVPLNVIKIKNEILDKKINTFPMPRCMYNKSIIRPTGCIDAYILYFDISFSIIHSTFGFLLFISHMTEMKYVQSLVLIALLLLPMFSHPTSAYGNISDESPSPSLRRGKQTLDIRQPCCIMSSQKVSVQIKKSGRMIPGGTRARRRTSSAVGLKTSLLQVCCSLLSFSIFFAFFVI